MFQKHPQTVERYPGLLNSVRSGVPNELTIAYLHPQVRMLPADRKAEGSAS